MGAWRDKTANQTSEKRAGRTKGYNGVRYVGYTCKETVNFLMGENYLLTGALNGAL